MATSADPAPHNEQRASFWRVASGIERLLGSDRGAQRAEIACIAAVALMGALSWYLIASGGGGRTPLSPPLAATLLVLNLLPASLLLMLIGRRVAIGRAERNAIGSKGRLHVQLVFLFSFIAATPTLLVAIFASFLFQNGVQFWYSDPARNMLENAGSLAQGYYEEKVRDVADETVTMAGDLRANLAQSAIEDPRFYNSYALQVIRRKLSDSAIVEIGDDGVQRTAAAINPADRTADQWLAPAMVEELLSGEPVAVNVEPEQIEVATPLLPNSRVFLYASRRGTSASYQLGERAQAVLQDYGAMIERSRALQLQFNAALYLISLLIIGFALWVALIVADRLVRPITGLVHAAKQVADGDLSTRVAVPRDGPDEIMILHESFNGMTERLEGQTADIMTANKQLDSRRQFIEAVLESVASGIISLDRNRRIALANSQAHKLLAGDEEDMLVGRPLGDVAEPFAMMLDQGERQAVLQMDSGPEPRTFAVRAEDEGDGAVISFEDITQQIVDQRRAAWSDVARRIAHEIKNPLTPINLAAERLKRRFAKSCSEEELPVFEQLTDTIVRQVSDLRKIVDEFSSFARMPKPIFRTEDLGDIVKHSAFLMEVAHPEISFSTQLGDGAIELVCDRRQIGQVVTNIVKNAVEAVESRAEKDENFDMTDGRILISLNSQPGAISLSVVDNGVGLPPARDTLTEPYMTTRKKGTGLGLAIVRKIVEEHFGEISFDDASGGGTEVRVTFNPVSLAAHSSAPTKIPQSGKK